MLSTVLVTMISKIEKQRNYCTESKEGLKEISNKKCRNKSLLKQITQTIQRNRVLGVTNVEHIEIITM